MAIPANQPHRSSSGGRRGDRGSFSGTGRATTRRTISCDGEASVAEAHMGLLLRGASCATIFRLR